MYRVYIYAHNNIRQWLKEFNSGGPCSTFVEKREKRGFPLEIGM